MPASRKVRDAMTREVLAVLPDTSLVTAARLFAARHISGAPVVDRHGAAVGVLAQSDLVDPDRDRSTQLGQPIYARIVDGKAVLVSGSDDTGEPGVAADLMSPYVIKIDEDAPLLDAIRLMVTDNVHRLLVTSGQQVIGILTAFDILRSISDWAATVAWTSSGS